MVEDAVEANGEMEETVEVSAEAMRPKRDEDEPKDDSVDNLEGSAENVNEQASEEPESGRKCWRIKSLNQVFHSSASSSSSTPNHSRSATPGDPFSEPEDVAGSKEHLANNLVAAAAAA